MADVPRLDASQRAFAERSRRATLATIAPDGRPRLVPICFALGEPEGAGSDRLYSPLDDKPKATSDPLRLARVRDIVTRPAVSLLIDRWSEDWTELGWLRIDAEATVLENQRPAGRDARAERERAIAALRARYPQYASHDLEARPILRFTVTRVTSWGELS